MNTVNRLIRFGLFLLTSVALFLTSAHPETQAIVRVPLTLANFRMVANAGFGDRGNTWAWTSGYINNHIVVGTGRWVTCANVYQSGGTPPAAMNCPPQAQMAAAQQAQIWSADASVGHPLTQADWTMQYQAPISGGVPVNDAFRGTSVFTDNFGNQNLFVSGVSYGTPQIPPSLLYSSDGATFTDIPQVPGTTMGDINQLTTTSAPQPLGMRGSIQFNDAFIVAITGGQGSGSLFASKTPLQGNNTFQQITPKSMFVWEIASFNNHLYISLASSNGYGVVRTDCTTPAPGTHACPASAFTTVIPFGAGIVGNYNDNVESMTVYTDPQGIQHLYVGAGVNPTGIIPPPPGAATTGAELTRINADDSWDVIVGRPRTVNGITKQPLSGLGEGFNNVNNKYMWSMDSYNGALYVGTWNVAYTGCQLWSSEDGTAFYPITTNGFGNPQCAGIRTTRGTPYGVFVGTVDDYGALQVWEGITPNTPPTSTPLQTATRVPTSTPSTLPTTSPTRTNTPTATTTPCPALTVTIAGWTDTRKNGNFSSATVDVKVTDNGSKVVGATVSGMWSNAHTGRGAGVTDGSGVAPISANGDHGKSTYTFTVTGVSAGCGSWSGSVSSTHTVP